MQGASRGARVFARSSNEISAVGGVWRPHPFQGSDYVRVYVNAHVLYATDGVDDSDGDDVQHTLRVLIFLLRDAIF
mgnify:CR=1 FL=1